MSYEILDYVDVVERARTLDCNVPSAIAILPRNFATAKTKKELIHQGSAPTVRILWRTANIEETKLEKESEKFPQVSEHAAHWIGPTLFLSYLTISENPDLVRLAINVISNYLSDLFKGIPSAIRKAKLDIVVETKNGNCKRIKYEGPETGLKELPKIIREVSTNE